MDFWKWLLDLSARPYETRKQLKCNGLPVDRAIPMRAKTRILALTQSRSAFFYRSRVISTHHKTVRFVALSVVNQAWLDSIHAFTAAPIHRWKCFYYQLIQLAPSALVNGWCLSMKMALCKSAKLWSRCDVSHGKLSAFGDGVWSYGTRTVAPRVLDCSSRNIMGCLLGCYIGGERGIGSSLIPRE